MYTWFFYKIYNFYKARNNHDPLFHSVGLVFISQIIHIMTFYLILSKILDFNTFKLADKLYFYPIGISWLILVNYYFKKNVKNNKTEKHTKVLLLYQLLIVLFFFMFVPLYIAIRLSGGQIWK